MAETFNVDEAVRVVVAPAQASYFAGEPFSVTVTFTNTRTPDASTPRSASHAHKRSAHSISSVPMARPPTSPGMLRTALPAVPTRNAECSAPLTRKGLIGKGRTVNGLGVTPGVAAVQARRPLVKSLSISITSHELEGGESTKGKSPLNPLRANGSLAASPSSPRIPSPLSRSTTLPIAPSHPHARKQSVLDGHVQIQDVRPPASPSPLSPSSNPSNSSYSLSLDPIAEGSNPPTALPTPAITSPVIETIGPIRTQLPSAPSMNGAAPSRPPQRRPPNLGHGPPPLSNTSINVKPPRSAFSSSFPTPNTELILYSYAQVVGTLSLSPAPGAVLTPEQVRSLNHVRSSLLKRQVVGGGSMDMTPLLSPQSFSPGLQPSGRQRHGRSNSVSSSIFSLLSPTTPASQAPAWKPSHRAQAPSMFSLFSSGQSTPSNGIGLGLGLGPGASLGGEEEVDPETPLPTFDVQPSMLAVDLSLAPGESRSYTYSLVLPENLPPTFKGKTLKLSYQFILGVCRAASNGPTSRSGAISANSSSRVMKVPIRVYCHVAVGRPPRPYDVLWPVSYWKSKGMQNNAKVIEEPKFPSKKPDAASTAPFRREPRGGSFEELQEYARYLLSSLQDPDPRVKLPLEAIELERDREREEAGALLSCRQAVEIITRNPRKASYDVNKDGVKVAVLTFTKSAYRLGETVLGVVELNERPSRARVLKLSAVLEAHESLPSALSPATTSRQMRRVHAEHHSSFLPSTLRTTFSLDIPPDASPAFQVDVGADQGSADRAARPGGLEWKVRLCLLVAVASPTAREGPDGVRLRHLVRDGPGGQWGTSWKAASTIAPMERPDLRAEAGAGAQSPVTPSTAASWLSYFTAPLMGPASTFHDGDEDGSDEAGTVIGEREEDWREVKAEMVECEVPIRVWPGNTAFKAMEVVFDV